MIHSLVPSQSSRITRSLFQRVRIRTLSERSLKNRALTLRTQDPPRSRMKTLTMTLTKVPLFFASTQLVLVTAVITIRKGQLPVQPSASPIRIKAKEKMPAKQNGRPAPRKGAPTQTMVMMKHSCCWCATFQRCM